MNWTVTLPHKRITPSILFVLDTCSVLAPTVSASSLQQPLPVSPDLEVTTSQFEHQTSPVVAGPTDG